MPRSHRFITPARVLTCCLAFALAWPTLTLADTARFEIEAEPLSAALKAFAQQAHIQLLYEYAIVQNIRGNPVIGVIEKRTALEALLRNTGLEAVFSSDDAATIRPISAARKRTEAPNGSPNKREKGKEEREPAASGSDPVMASDGASKGSAISEVTKSDSKHKEPKLQEVVVTGSRLQETDIQSPEPVDVYTSQQIEASGQTTPWGFLSTLPDVATTQSGPADIETFGGQETVQLHGLPTGTVLVLLNGQRLPDQWYGFFDLGMIPAAAIQRIEVLPVGSSAVYGSDAVAGAVNIVLKEAFNGADAQVTSGWASGTNETDSSIDIGHQWDRGSVLFVGSFRTNSILSGSDRSVTADQNFKAYGGPNAEVTYCNPGNIYSLSGQNLPGLNSTYAGIPSGLSGTPTAADFTATSGKLNECSGHENNALIGPATNYGGLLTGDYNVSDTTELFARVLYTDDTLATPLGISSFTLPKGAGYTLSADNPYNPFSENVGISYSYNVPGHPAAYYNDSNFVDPLLGIRGDLGRSWNYTATVSFAQNSTLIADQTATNTSLVREALSSTNAATAFNPFASGGPGSMTLIDSFLEPTYNNKFIQSMYSAQGFVRGSLFSLPSGPVNAVIGGEDDRQRVFSSLAGEGENVSQTTAYRRNWALFSEVQVPLVASATDSGLGSKLALSLAGRYDHYSDFGGAATGQAGLVWRPISSLILRGAYANDYKAPDLTDLYAAPLTYSNEITDPYRGGEQYVVPSEQGGNPHLGPETGRSETVGLIYLSHAISHLKLTVTQWGVELNNYINTVNQASALLYPTAYPGAVTRAPPTAQDIAQGYLGVVTNLNLSYANYGDVSVSGIDYGVDYNAETRWGTVAPSIHVTQTYKYQAALSPGLPSLSYLSQANASIGFAPKWKGTATIGWRLGPYSVSIDSRFTGRYRDYQEEGPNSHELGDFWLFDGNLRYNIGQLSDRYSWLQRSYIQIGGVNLFNRSPQWSWDYIGYDPAEADIRGRYLYAGFEVGF